MKKRSFIAVLLALVLAASTALAVPYGPMTRYRVKAKQRLALRSGPGTHYTELFSIDPGSMKNLAVLQLEYDGSTTWALIEFESKYGTYRAYTGLKRLETSSNVPYGNREGETYILVESVEPCWGPGYPYEYYDEIIPKGTPVTVYHEVGGYVMVDVMLPSTRSKGKSLLTRCWIASDTMQDFWPAGY